MKIIIEVSGKEYKVTESEARHIYQQLEGLFKEKESTLFPHNPNSPLPILPPMFSPQQPTIDPYNPWKTTCGGGSNGWGG
ncbi:MAG: hypothetical protein KAJ03_12400 [Gammaproteobacteria bacterium]|nr:hypothetical protein [Gammaproteobacteria bacterium]